MKYLLLALLLIPSFAFADTYSIPEGCYIAYSEPENCFEISPMDQLIWPNSEDDLLLSPTYGSIVSVLIARSANLTRGLGLCDGAYNSVKLSNRKQNTVISKLRKKCGKPCKNIK